MKVAGWKQLRIMNAFAMLVCTLLGLCHMLTTFLKLNPSLFGQDWNKAEQLFSDLFQRRGFRWGPDVVVILAEFHWVFYIVLPTDFQ
jgi:hypothetical protein